MKVSRRLALCVPLVLLLQGCGGTLYMRAAETSEVLTAPPPGKALVNIHRPSDYGADRLYAIFDGTTLVGMSHGEQRLQVVCAPGKRVFLGYLKESVWSTTSVIEADLAADKVYDLVVDLGYFTSSIELNPLAKGDKRRAKLAAWEAEQDVMVLDASSGFAEWVKTRRERNAAMVKAAGKGEPAERLKRLAKDDHR